MPIITSTSSMDGGGCAWARQAISDACELTACANTMSLGSLRAMVLMSTAVCVSKGNRSKHEVRVVVVVVVAITTDSTQ